MKTRAWTSKLLFITLTAIGALSGARLYEEQAGARDAVANSVRCAALDARIQKLRSLEVVAASDAKNISLSDYTKEFLQAGAKVGIEESQLVSIRSAPPVDLKGSDYLRHDTHVTLTNVTVSTLVAFLFHCRDELSLCPTKVCLRSGTTDKTKNERWTADLSLSNLSYAAKASK